MNNKLLVAALTLLSVVGCSTASSGKAKSETDFAQVKLGDSKSSIEKIFGSAEVQTFKDGILELRTLSYVDQTTKFEVDFILDSTSKVISRSRDIPLEKPKSLIETLHSIYGPADFKTYSPCHTFFTGEKLLIDEKKGFFVAVSDRGPLHVAWEEPELTRKRVRYLYEKCGVLQPARNQK